jgi:hypothetical protein
MSATTITTISSEKLKSNILTVRPEQA